MDQESGGMRTSLYSILCIAIRLGAVMLAWTTIQKLGFLLGQGQFGKFPAMERLIAAGYFGVGLLVAFLLWVYPGLLARIAVGRSAGQTFESPITAAELQWVALSVLGVYWAMTGLLDLFYMGYQFLWMPEFLGNGSEAERLWKLEIAFNLVVILLGISLTLGARGLTSLLQKARYAGSSGIARKLPAEPDTTK